MSSSNSRLLNFTKKYPIFKRVYLFYNIYIRNYNFLYDGNQLGEEEKLLSYFKKDYKGRYVDIGCFHPTKHSNTSKFYKRKWKGINIDLNPLTIDLFNYARPRDINICAAISNSNKSNDLYFVGDLSSENTLEKNHTKWLKKTFNYNQKKFLKKRIKTKKINDILDKYKFYDIDFMNIDVEGHEIKILNSLNLNKFNIKYFCIEIISQNYSQKHKNDILNYFKKNNYKIKYIDRIVGINYIFKKII